MVVPLLLLLAALQSQAKLRQHRHRSDATSTAATDAPSKAPPPPPEQGAQKTAAKAAVDEALRSEILLTPKDKLVRRVMKTEAKIRTDYIKVMKKTDFYETVADLQVRGPCGDGEGEGGIGVALVLVGR